MKFNKRIATFAMVAMLSVGGTLYTTGAALAAEPGTSDDPLVTKSYVDGVVSNLLGMLSSGNGTGTFGDAASTFMPVRVMDGEILIGGEGTEIILRSGTAKSYTSSENGLIDITSGKEFFNGVSLEQNHLLIVARADGRGAIVTSEEAWFMIKGSYSVN